MPEDARAADASSAEPWAIIGGGLLGLTLALRLAQAGRKVTVFEAASELGGLAGAWRIGDYVWDRHYHVTLESDVHLRGMLAELGLDQEFVWRSIETGMLHGGRLHTMTRPLDLLRFPGLGFVDKARLALTVLAASRVRDWRPLEQVSAIDWLTRWSGKRTVERIWRPLLESKLGPNADRVAASFIWASITRLQGARDARVKSDRFGYLPGGYARILARLGERLASLGVEIRLGQAVRSVTRSAPCGQEVTLADGARLRFARTIVTAPSPLVSRLCPGLSEAERAAHDAIRYQGIVCASLLLRRPLSKFYVLNLADAGLPFTGVIEMTALVDRAQFGGNSLVYLPRYVAADDPAMTMDDATLRAEQLAGLRRIFPDLVEADVLAYRVSRVRNVFAIPDLGFSTRLPKTATSIPGLHIVNSAQIVNGTLNVNETVQLAETAAARLLADRGDGDDDGWASRWAREDMSSPQVAELDAREFVRRATPLLAPRRDDVVLDLGCGRGRVAALMSECTQAVHGVDVNCRVLAAARLAFAARANLAFHALSPANYTRLSVVDGRRFSLILCVSVLQYYRSVAEIVALLDDLRRRTLPEARLLIADFPTPGRTGRETIDTLRAYVAALGPLGTLRLVATMLGFGRELRRRPLLRLTREQLTEAIRRTGASVEVIDAPLTIRRSRINLLVRFTPPAAVVA
jgi:protoporphyrinogen oxidase/ubiquinone/menaquinone biosynthesis C-methylase UbiE